MKAKRPGIPSLVLSESFFRALIEQTNDLVSVLDAEAIIHYVSPSHRWIVGYEPAELIGRNGFDFVHPDDVEMLLSRFRRAATSPGQTSADEYRFRHRDGTWRILQAVGLNLLADDSVRGVVVTARDVTEHRQAVRQVADHRRLLGEKLAELELIHRTAPVGLAIVDTDLRFVRINDRLAVINGASPADHVGRSLQEILPQLGPALEPICLDVLESGAPALDVEIRGATPAEAGVERDFLASFHRLDDACGRPVGVSAVVQDITERKNAERVLERTLDELESRVARRTAELTRLNDALRAEIGERERVEESLRRSEERYRDLVENVSDVIFSVDGEGRITYVSPAIEHVGGRTAAEVIGRSFLDFVHPEDAAALIASFQRTLGGESEPSEYRVLGKSGEVRWLRSHSRVTMENGRVVSVHGVLTDLTDRRRAEMEARQQRAEMAHVQRLTTAGEMTAEIAHQINQPLAAIVNFAGGLAARLREGTVHPETMREVASRISTEARRAGEVIRRLRAFLRRGESTPAECDLNNLVLHVFRLVEEDFQREGIEVEIALAPALPELRLDAILIEQVVLNLLRNALEAMSSGADIRHLAIVTREVENSVCVTLEDSGVGLPIGDEHRVFDAFFTTKAEGLGLGLSVSRSIVEASGGRLWATPNGSRGTTVGFALPRPGSPSPAAGRGLG